MKLAAEYLTFASKDVRIPLPSDCFEIPDKVSY